ncbi:MAG: esterase [Hyphomicrobium sp.]|nr:esterase [Hyphomicrobium sp.]PPD08561.1 MAG: esterase [Hyphomicrobium sp.]
MTTKPPDMSEATRLTRSGRLTEATALIKRLLGVNGPPQPSRASGPALTQPILDLVAEVVSTSAPTVNTAETQPQSSTPFSTSPKDLPTHQRAPSALAPDPARYAAETFSNAAGQRTYKLYSPSPTHSGPRPLVVMLHGCTQSADDFAAGTRMNFAAEDDGCFVAYPEQIPSANPQKCWNWFQTGHQSRDRGEPSIIAGIVKHIMSQHDIDPRRIYIAGLSAGGAAAAVVAEAYPDLFAALGVHSGLACGSARDLPSALAAMQGRHPPHTPTTSAPIPAIVFHGDQDKTVHPRNGADVVKSATACAAYVSETEHGRVPSGRTYARTILRDGSGKTMIEDWVIHGAGHAWSGGSTAGSFTDPHGPDATHEMLRFFLEHQLTPTNT